MPCSLLVATVAEKPRAVMAPESPCAKASSESISRILLDTKGPVQVVRGAKAYERDTRGVNETVGISGGCEWLGTLSRPGRLHKRQHVLIGEIGDQRVDKLAVPPR